MTRPIGRRRRPTSSACTRSWPRCLKGTGNSTPNSFRGSTPQLARDMQRAMGRLEKSKSPDSPVLPGPRRRCGRPAEPSQSPRPVHQRLPHPSPARRSDDRPLAGQGDQVETFYERLQAHFDAALEGFRKTNGRPTNGSKTRKTLAYLAALDAIEVRMADRLSPRADPQAQSLRALHPDGG